SAVAVPEETRPDCSSSRSSWCHLACAGLTIMVRSAAFRSVATSVDALEIGHLSHKAGGTAGQNSLDFFSKMVYSTVDGSSCRPPSQASNPFGEDRFVLRACADRQRTESGS